MHHLVQPQRARLQRAFPFCCGLWCLRRDLVRLGRLIARRLRDDLHLGLADLVRLLLLLCDGPVNRAEGEKETQDEECAFGLGHLSPRQSPVLAHPRPASKLGIAVALEVEHLGQRAMAGVA